jgi:hypothetical protein
MKKALAIGLLGLALAGCPTQVPPQVLSEWQGRTLYTCCNIHYEGASVSDANYLVGSTLPFGTQASVLKMTGNSITIHAGATDLTLGHSYGSAQESAEQYFNKVLVPTDPHSVFATYPKDVQTAIENSHVEVGMTKPQVLLSLGYPPTHRTASIDLNTWTYWYNRWLTYEVHFGDNGKVVGFIGNAPTTNQPILELKPTPAPAPRKSGKKK